MANNYTHETFTVDGQEFACMCNLTTKVLQITSVHPYDETEYHWARKKPNRSVWEVYRSGKRVCLIPNTSREKVAATLLRYDKNTRLTPRCAIW